MGKNKLNKSGSNGQKTVKNPEELAKVIAEKEAQASKEGDNKPETQAKKEGETTTKVEAQTPPAAKTQEQKPADKPAEKKPENKPSEKKEEKKEDKKPGSGNQPEKKDDKKDKTPPATTTKGKDAAKVGVAAWKPLDYTKIEEFMNGISSSVTGGNGLTASDSLRAAATYAELVKLNPKSKLLAIQDSVDAIVAMYIVFGNLQLFKGARNFGIQIQDKTAAERMVSALVILGADVKLSADGLHIDANISDEIYKAIQSDQAAKTQLALDFDKHAGAEDAKIVEEGYEIPDPLIERTEDEKKEIIRIILSKDRGSKFTMGRNLKDAVEWIKKATKFEGTFEQTVARIMLRFTGKDEADTMIFATLTKSIGNALHGSHNPFDAMGILGRAFFDPSIEKSELFSLFRLYSAKFIGKNSDGPEQTKKAFEGDEARKQVDRQFNLEAIEKIAKGEDLTYTEDELKAIGLTADKVKFTSARVWKDWLENMGTRTGAGTADHVKTAKALMVEFADYLVNNPQKTLYEYAEEVKAAPAV